MKNGRKVERWNVKHGWMDWIGLDWIGLDWIGLDWIGLDWIGLDWIGLDWMDGWMDGCMRVYLQECKYEYM